MIGLPSTVLGGRDVSRANKTYQQSRTFGRRAQIRLLTRFVELAGPAKSGGRARVLQQDVFRTVRMFPRSDGPTFFDDALDQLTALARAA